MSKNCTRFRPFHQKSFLVVLNEFTHLFLSLSQYFMNITFSTVVWQLQIGSSIFGSFGAEHVRRACADLIRACDQMHKRG